MEVAHAASARVEHARQPGNFRHPIESDTFFSLFNSSFASSFPFHLLHQHFPMASQQTLVQEWFASPSQKFAVVGASSNRTKFGNKVLRW